MQKPRQTDRHSEKDNRHTSRHTDRHRHSVDKKKKPTDTLVQQCNTHGETDTGIRSIQATVAQNHSHRD